MLSVLLAGKREKAQGRVLGEGREIDPETDPQRYTCSNKSDAYRCYLVGIDNLRDPNCMEATNNRIFLECRLSEISVVG